MTGSDYDDHDGSGGSYDGSRSGSDRGAALGVDDADDASLSGDDGGSDPDPDVPDDDDDKTYYDDAGAAGGAGAASVEPPQATGTMKGGPYTIEQHKEGKPVHLLASLFPHRKATVAIDYPPYLGIKRNMAESSLAVLAATSRRVPVFKISEAVHEYNCVRNAFLRAGFKRTTGSGWNVLWGRHLKEEEFMRLNPYQKVNHFPGTWALGRKDRLARNMARMQREFGDHFDFHSHTYILPADRLKLKSEMEADPKTLWILKPCASSCGRGIRVVSHAAGSKIPRGKSYLAQKYVRHPYLIDGRKFDLRIYVLVTCFDPLRVYLFHDGLVRFCTEKYSTAMKNIKNRFAHLTNYSVNKKSQKFDKNQDAQQDGVGTKWSLQALRRWFRERGIDDERVMANIRDVIIKTLISCESHVGSLVGRYFRGRTPDQPGSNCFEVFGFDVLLDRHLKAWILEVNVSPSLSSSSPLDKKIKNTLMTDAFHLMGIVPFDPKKHEKDKEATKMNRLLGLDRSSRVGTTRHRNVRELSTMGPEDLLPDELAVICETEDELARRGHFQRIFPAENAAYYLQFFETPRFNNVLLLMWLNKWKALCDTGAVERPRPLSLGRDGTDGTDMTPRSSGSATPRTGRAGSMRRGMLGSSGRSIGGESGGPAGQGFGRAEVLSMLDEASGGASSRTVSSSGGRRRGKKATGGFEFEGDNPYGNVAVITKDGRSVAPPIAQKRTKPKKAPPGVPPPAVAVARQAAGSRSSGSGGAYSDRSSVSTGSHGSVGGRVAVIGAPDTVEEGVVDVVDERAVPTRPAADVAAPRPGHGRHVKEAGDGSAAGSPATLHSDGVGSHGRRTKVGANGSGLTQLSRPAKALQDALSQEKKSARDFAVLSARGPRDSAGSKRRGARRTGSSRGFTPRSETGSVGSAASSRSKGSRRGGAARAKAKRRPPAGVSGSARVVVAHRR